MSPTLRITALLVALALGFAWSDVRAASAQEPVGAAQALSALNAQRAAHGIPADIVEVPDWSRSCALHMNYVQLNNDLRHEEYPGDPGYTPEGAWAGRSAVLTSADLEGWFRDRDPNSNPWENAPIHLMQTLAPGLSRTGASVGCLVTWPGYSGGTNGPRMFSYPRDGATEWRTEESAFELPFVPGDFVGLPRGTTTGPHLYLLADGMPSGRLVFAEVIGPDGPVEIRTVDNATPQVGGYLPAGGIVIPVAPLRNGGLYSVRAVFDAGGTTLEHAFSFRTARLDPATYASVSARGVEVHSASTQRIHLRVTRLPSRTPVTEADLASGEDLMLPLRGARYELCMDQPETDVYRGVSTCRLQTFRSPPDIRVGAPHRTGRVAVFPITGGVAAGETGDVRIERWYRACRTSRCPWRMYDETSRTVLLRQRGSLRVRIAKRARRAIRVQLVTPSFARGDWLYERQRLYQSFER